MMKTAVVYSSGMRVDKTAASDEGDDGDGLGRPGGLRREGGYRVERPWSRVVELGPSWLVVLLRCWEGWDGVDGVEAPSAASATSCQAKEVPSGWKRVGGWWYWGV
jgi:hypothetical protein